MAKNSGSANKTQSNIFIQHVEKIGLLATILLGAMFAWYGFSIEKLDERKSPEKLKEKSASIAIFINEPSWEGDEGLSLKRSAPSDYPERVQKLQRPIISQNYETIMPFDPPTVGQTTRRSDPNLYAAMDLHAFAITASLAYKKSADVEDPTTDDGDPRFEIDEKKKKKKPRQNQYGSDDFGDEMDSASPEGPGGDMGGDDPGGVPSDGGDTAWLTPVQLIGFRPGANRILESGTVVEIKGAGRAASGGNMGGEAGGMAVSEMDEGTGMEGEMEAMMGSGGGGGSASSSVPQPSTVVAVVGVVPYRKQWDEYSRVLQGASGYESSRDRPRYVYLYAERVDVTDDPERAINEDEWEKVSRFSDHRRDTRNWDGTPRELVEEKYLDPFITFVCPPIMMRDLTKMLSHDLIPLRNAPKEVEQTEESLDDDPENPPVDAPGGFVDRPGNASGGQVAAGGAAGGSDMPGMGDDMESDMMEDMMGGMGGGMGAGNIMSSRSIPEFLMVRFFDFSRDEEDDPGPKPGRVYRYRVRLLLEDPNHPNIHVRPDYPQHAAPPNRSLNKDVIARIVQMDDAKHDIFFRQTKWSEPTAPIRVPNPNRVFAGMVNEIAQNPQPESKQIPVQPKVRLSYVDKEPKGTLLPVVWDKKRGVDIPLLNDEVRRGSMLNQGKKGVHYGHPSSTLIKWINNGEEFEPVDDNDKPEDKFRTDFTVADIRGGEDLPGSTKEYPVRSPGEFALFDSTGRLIVRNELDDLDGFKRYDFREQLTKDKTTGANATGTGASSGTDFGVDGDN